MKNTFTYLKAALAAMLAIAGPSPFDQMPRATPKPSANTAGSKLARMASEKRLTGNRMSHYGRGLLNQFAAMPRSTRGALV